MGASIFDIPVQAAAWDNATVIENGKTIKTTVQESDETEPLYYKFVVTEIGTVKLDFHFEYLGNGYYYIYDSAIMDKAITAVYYSVDYDTQIRNKTFEKIMTPGTYYIKVEHNGREKKNGKYVYKGGNFSITYSFSSSNVNKNIDTDNNNSIPDATNWDYKKTPSFNGAFPGYVEDMNDYYKISVLSEKYMHFKVVSTGRIWNINFYNGNGDLLDSYYTSYKEALNQYILDVDLTFTGGIYYLGISCSTPCNYNVLFEEKVIPKEEDRTDTSSTESSAGTSENKESIAKGPVYRNEWVDGKWYDANGAQTYNGTLMWKSNSTGWWVEDTAGWYPRNSWQKIDGVWYYFMSSGYMAAGEYFNGYWFNSNGSLNETYFLSWKSNAKGWWVEDKSGWWPSSSWLKIDGYWYYFNSSGYMVTSQYIDGYWIGADGVCR